MVLALTRLIKRILGLPVILTRAEINAIPIEESGEALVPLVSAGKLRVNEDPDIFFRKSEFPAITEHKVRATVAEMLAKAAASLPEGHALLVLESFRPYAVQLERFEAKKAALREQFPDITEAETARLARMGIADPRGGAPHQTGGAVDVTIVGPEGLLPMGTVWAEFDRRKTPTKSWNITREERRNRALLLRCMEDAGFSNYPGEWWHFSYGDRMWACYRKEPKAVYGGIAEAR